MAMFPQQQRGDSSTLMRRLRDRVTVRIRVYWESLKGRYGMAQGSAILTPS
jgi:hypothetical protein